MKTFLTHGEHSNVYLDHDDVHGDIIIKQSRANPNSNAFAKYAAKQQHGYDVIKEIRNSGMDFGVVLPELISIENNTVIEKRITGVDFKEDIYNKLTTPQKEDIAHKMAMFLNTMHQMRDPLPPRQSILDYFTKHPTEPASTSEFATLFEGNLSQKCLAQIASAETALKNADRTSQVQVMTHSDLRDQNIMYDAANNRIAVIDFEMARVDNIYRDFVPGAPASAMPWDFIQRVIRHYNAIPNKKNQITIDAVLVKNALTFGIAQEFSRVLAIKKQRNSMDITIAHTAHLLERRLNKLTQTEDMNIVAMAQIMQQQNA